MTKQKTDIREVLNEQVPEERDELYNDYVDENTPKLSWFANLCKAFLVGGLICTLGQVLIIHNISTFSGYSYVLPPGDAAASVLFFSAPAREPEQ